MNRKKALLLTLAGFFLYNTAVQAQNNLQFNKVVYLEVDSLVICNSGGACVDTILMRNITVPEGKVLKVESVNYRTTYNYLLYLNLTPFATNSTSTGFPPHNTFPIWLPAGTHRIYFFLKNNPSAVSVNLKFSYQLSALEFNVVQ